MAVSKILSIGTGVPEFCHQQQDILQFMQRVYAPDETGKRKLKFLYHQGGIDQRYSVVPDYSLPASDWTFYSPTENLEPFPSIEKRMEWFHRYAAPLSFKAANDCLKNYRDIAITHLITVSCTGLSAPGLDIELAELLHLPPTVFRTSVNFMGCYAAVHALKLAHAFCQSDESVNVLIVCTELCTLHFQKEDSPDNITSSMLFADGSAAVLVSNGAHEGLSIDRFYSHIASQGKKDMAWEVSSTGFVMTLSSYIPDLIRENFDGLVKDALLNAGVTKEEITGWCIHPGGKRILESVHQSLGFTNGQLDDSFSILKEYGNMSSATVLFVLKRMMERSDAQLGQRIFAAAFGPGLTMETVIFSS